MNGSRRCWRVVSLLLASGLHCTLTQARTWAQQPGRCEKPASVTQTTDGQSPAKSADKAHKPAVHSKEHEPRGAFVIAPLPISSPALGSGIVPVLAYIFSFSRSDKTSPASVVGAAGLITDNGSSGFILAGQLYFKENTYRTNAVFARGNLNYDLYGMGDGTSQSKLPLTQTGQAFLGEFLRRLGWDFFVGPRLFSGNSLIVRRASDTGSAPLPPDLGLHTMLRSIGFRLNRDTRPNRFYPTTGTVLDFTSDFFAQTLGSKYSFQSYRLTFNKYSSLSHSQVLAYNLFACATGGQPPFYGNCIYGRDNELRGYIAGRYLDRYMLATQVEYRASLRWRLGAVGFAGLGEVIPGGNQPFRTKNFLPSGGGGVRFQLSKKYHVNLRVDIAQGKDSHTWSAGVGEAF